MGEGKVHRFPHNWAITDMVKDYIARMRKDHYRQACEDEGEWIAKTAPGMLKNDLKDSNIDEDKDNDEVPPP
jgi:hypothetical protein